VRSQYKRPRLATRRLRYQGRFVCELPLYDKTIDGVWGQNTPLRGSSGQQRPQQQQQQTTWSRSNDVAADNAPRRQAFYPTDTINKANFMGRGLDGGGGGGGGIGGAGGAQVFGQDAARMRRETMTPQSRRRQGPVQLRGMGPGTPSLNGR
jgi:hypothetical protein